jgi:multidrug efflux system outer membrane protein
VDFLAPSPAPRRQAALVPLLTALLALGCAPMGPNYKRPELGLEPGFRTQAQAEAASLADRPWWEVFGDPALQALVGEALEHNYDTRLAAERVEEYRARAGIERAAEFPTFTPGAGWTRGRSSSFTASGGNTGAIFNVQVSMAWELDLWGRVRRLNEAARAQYLGAQDARRGVFLSVAAQVAEAYFSLRELDARLEIAKATTRSFQETWELFNRRQLGGAASALETARAEAALATAASTIPNLERQLRAQENQLCFLLGRGPGPIARGAALAEQPLPPGIPAGLPAALLERRPDLRVAEQQLVAANAAVGVVQASFFPTLSLNGLAGGIAPHLADLFASGREWDINPSFSGPALPPMRLKNQKAAAVAQWEQARTRYQSAVAGAYGEVATLLEAADRLAEVEAQQARAVAAYQEAVRLATLRYTAGLSSYIEVLEAQEQLFPAENNRSQTRLARLDTVVQLYKALGGGWNLKDPGDGGWALKP